VGDPIAWVLAYLLVGMLFAIVLVVVEAVHGSGLKGEGALITVLLWPVIPLCLIMATVDRWTRREVANLSSQTIRNRSKRQRKRRAR